MGDAAGGGDEGGAVLPDGVPAAPLTDVLRLLADVALPADDPDTVTGADAPVSRRTHAGEP